MYMHDHKAAVTLFHIVLTEVKNDLLRLPGKPDRRVEIEIHFAVMFS